MLYIDHIQMMQKIIFKEKTEISQSLKNKIMNLKISLTQIKKK